MMKKSDNIFKKRYERKYLIPEFDQKDVEIAIKLNPLSYSEIYHERRVNSIYLDTQDNESYHENLSGVGNRTKVRVRWYGEDLKKANEPNLEIKIKTGLLGEKLIYSLPDFDVKNLITGFNSKAYFKEIVPEPFNIKLLSISPVILISYLRRYFISADQNYRLTIDTDLKFYSTDYLDHSTSYFNGEGAIVELKYDEDKEESLKVPSNQLFFRLSKCSKYVLGLDTLFGFSE